MIRVADGTAVARVGMKPPRWRRTVAALVGLTLLATGTVGATAALASTASAKASVIVLVRPGQQAEARRLAVRLGGEVARRFPALNGFAADLPTDAVAAMLRSHAIVSIAPDRRLKLLDSSWGSSSPLFSRTLQSIEADDMWQGGHTGAGIDVALIDSGVSAVAGLAGDDQVINGPDLSFDLQAGGAPYIDSFGHGTHMAGIIAGRDPGVDPRERPSPSEFLGVAPGARIVNVKVAGPSGETDVSQVIAAIDWVVQHRSSDGLNIRVLNLSFGTDGGQTYQNDPLAYAAEVAWRHGIVVVTAAGNAGADLGRLDDPAYDPFVIAVGADNTKGTAWMRDDVIPTWSSLGDGVRNPDIVAPGAAVRSFRAPGSLLDRTIPQSVAGPRWIGGSGTSQAAAVVSGAAALLLEARPQLTPDQVKGLLVSTATPVPGADETAQGAGLLDVEAAMTAHAPASVQTWERSKGTGSLEAARGSTHLAMDGVVLRGEQDIFGAAWDSKSWSALSDQGAAWTAGTWNGSQWAGGCFCQLAWSGLSWSGLSWSGLSWSGLSWSGLSWSGLSWSGLSWSTAAWGDG